MTVAVPEGRAFGRRRLVLAMLVAALAVAMVVAAAVLLRPRAEVAVPAAPPSTEFTRGPSGLRVRPIQTEISLAGRPPDDLMDAYAVADRLADENVDDFGWPSFDHGVVRLPATSDLSAPLTEATTADGRRAALQAYDHQVRVDFPRHPSPPDLLSKRLKLTPGALGRFGDQVVVVPGRLSVRDIQDRQDQVLTLAVRFKSAEATSCGYNRQLGAVSLELVRLTPELAAALVQRFGTEDVVVELIPHSSARTGTG